MLKSCSICGGIHDESNMCKRQYKNKKDTIASNFRNKNVWIIKREQVKKRDKYLCQMCLKNNIYTYNNIQVHHIIPLVEQYSKRLDSDNLITLCSTHHKDAEMGYISKEELYSLIESPPRVNNQKI